MTNQHVNICVGDINRIWLNQWLFNKKSVGQHFINFPISFNEITYICISGTSNPYQPVGNNTNPSENPIRFINTAKLMMYSLIEAQNAFLDTIVLGY